MTATGAGIMRIYVFLGCLLAASAHSQAAQDETELAKQFLHCQYFYSMTHKSAMLKDADLVAPGTPLAKLPHATRVIRLLAETLVGEKEAEAIYSDNFAEWSFEYLAAADSAEAWKTLSASMTSTCVKLTRDHDAEFTPRLLEYMKQRGIQE